MKYALFILSAILILGSVALAVFVEPKSGNVEGAGWKVPFWPFVLALGVVLSLVSVAITPFGRDLIRMYFRTKVEIARAENHVPAEAEEKTVNPTPPLPEQPPTDIAKT